MNTSTDPRWWGLLFASFLLSAFVTWLSIRYAHRRNLIDQPGRRRSHSLPTPRGGGIGIAVAAVLGCLYLSLTGAGQPTALIAAIVLIAAVGWIDDHRGLSAVWRLAAQIVAAALIFAPLWYALLIAPGKVEEAMPAAHALLWLGVFLAIGTLGLVWSINLHNFMDGINGLLGVQAVFVFCALASLYPDNAGLPALWAAAVLGFLPFNFPRARIFMGDVGSGVLGLLIGLTVLGQSPDGNGLANGVIACSAFVTDATCTLLSRMLRGRRWYSAHREHLYQWLARSGFSHAGVVALYMGWNFVVVAPVLYLANRGGADAVPRGGLAWALAVYALALGVWLAGKRWCLHRAKMIKSSK